MGLERSYGFHYFIRGYWTKDGVELIITDLRESSFFQGLGLWGGCICVQITQISIIGEGVYLLYVSQFAFMGILNIFYLRFRFPYILNGWPEGPRPYC